MNADRTGSLEDNEEPSLPAKVLRRIRNELAIEVVFVVLCFVLAISLNGKVAIAVVVACLKFAIPDFVTAFLVWKHDSSRAHGIGVALLFMATGMARASQFAFAAGLLIACTVIPWLGAMGMGNIGAVGLGVGFVCAYGFLASIFPITFVAAAVSKFSKTKLHFASGLTKLRRIIDNAQNENKRKQVTLDVERSLGVLATASGISLAMCIIGLLFLIPQNAMGNAAVPLVLISGAILPFVWIPVFAILVSPASD